MLVQQCDEVIIRLGGGAVVPKGHKFGLRLDVDTTTGRDIDIIYAHYYVMGSRGTDAKVNRSFPPVHHLFTPLCLRPSIHHHVFFTPAFPFASLL